MAAQQARTAAETEARGFGEGEHLLIGAWRRIAAGQANCLALAQAFDDVCGEDGADVFLTFCTFLKALGFAGRRPLIVGTPGSPSITADECQVFTLIAAAQAGAPALFAAHLRWLTHPGQRHVLEIATGALATALTVNTLRLALPAPDPSRRCERPPAGGERAATAHARAVAED